MAVVLGVLAAPPVALATSTTPTITATGGYSLNAGDGSPVSGNIATFSYADTSAPASQFSAHIQWGDGTTSLGTISGANGSFTVAGSHSYATEDSSFTVTVTIDDSANPGNNASVTDSALVDDPISALSGLLTGVEGGYVSYGNYPEIAGVYEGDYINGPEGDTDVTASISWGDGTVNAMTLTPAESGYRASAPPHAYAEEGTYTVTFHLNDADGADTSVTTTASIKDASLTAKSHAPVRNGNTVSGTLATFTDADSAAPATDYSAQIKWGDGSTSVGNVNSGSVSGEHSYGAPGSYRVRVTILDAGGSSATKSVKVVVPKPSPPPGSSAPSHAVGHARVFGLPHGCSAFRRLRLTVRGSDIAKVHVRFGHRSVHARTLRPGTLYRIRLGLRLAPKLLRLRIFYTEASSTPPTIRHWKLRRCRA